MSVNMDFIGRLGQAQGLAQQMMERLPEAIYLSDPDTGGLLYGNAALEGLTGLTLAELQALGREGVRARVHPDDWQRLEGQGGAGPLEFRWLRRDGAYRWLSGPCLPLPADEDHPRLLLGTLRDITAQKQAEQAWRESERRTRILLDTSSIAFLLLSPDGIILDLDAGMARRLGARREEALGRDVHDLLPPAVAANRRAMMEKALRAGQPLRYQDENHGRLLDHRLHPILDDAGRITAIAVYAEDITEWARAERAQAETERKYRELVQHVPTGIYEIDLRASRFITVNDALCQMLGYSREELLAMDPLDLLDEEGRARFRARAAQWLGAESPDRNAEYRVRAKDGRIVDVVLDATFTTDERGNPLGVTVVAHDITERKRAEATLREREAARQVAEAVSKERNRLYEVLETLPATICLLTPDHHVAFANRGFREMFGDPQGRHCYEVCFGQAQPCAFCQSYRVLETGQPHRWEVRYGDIVLEAHDFPFTDVDGSPMILEMDLDITERVRAEEALRKLNETLEQRIVQRTEQLRELNETLEQRVAERTRQLRALTAELSRAEESERKRIARVLHDQLQQLLVAARLNVNSLGRRLPDPALHRLTAQADEVLEEALRVSRSLTTELIPPMLYDAGLTPALHWLARWMKEKYDLSVEVNAEELDNDTPEVARAVLFQAARELLFNVVKHAGVDRATVKLRRLPEDRLELVVEDLGAGLALAKTGLDSGSGFGLFHLRERLEILGGGMEVRSAPGQGTRVRLRLSQRAAEANIAAKEEAPAAGQAVARDIRRGGAHPPDQAATMDAALAPVRVLLVDDHTIMREGLAHLLTNEAGLLLVGQAGDGREAVELARATRPDIVLMDVSMPVMDGVEATRCILTELPATRVIGLSMYNDPEVARRMREAGAVDYISKGGDPAALLRALHKWVS